MTDNKKAKKMLTDSILKVLYFLNGTTTTLYEQADPQYIPKKDDYIIISGEEYIVHYNIFEPIENIITISLMPLAEYNKYQRRKN